MKKALLIVPLAGLLGGMLVYAYFQIGPSENAFQYASEVTANLSNNLVAGPPNKRKFDDLTDPKFVSLNDATAFLKPEDEVIVLRGKEKTLALPVTLMSWHHIVNLELDNKPIAATYCLLADAAVTFSRSHNNKVLSLGVLGNLYLGDLIMYDRETDSSFLQLSGDAFSGALKGTKLTPAFSSERITFSKLKEIPNALVMAPVKEMDYYRVFEDQNKSAMVGLMTLKMKNIEPDKRLVPLTRGIGITVQKQNAFFTLSQLERVGVVNENVGGWALAATYSSRTQQYSVWRRHVRGQMLTFEVAEGGFRDRETQTLWNDSGLAVEGTLKNEQLIIPEFVRVYWYNWAAIYPNTRLIAAEIQ